MLSVFSLKNALNESAAFGGSVNAGVYNFVGDLNESTFMEANYVVMSEAAGISEFITASDEAMVEAVVSGTLTESQQYALSENVFTQIIEGIKKFIKKVIEVIKGLINKLKAFFYKFTGKTSKWVGVMRKPIEDAIKNGGENARNFKYMMHKWNEDYILKTLTAAVAIDDLASVNTANDDLTKKQNDVIDEFKEWSQTDEDVVDRRVKILDDDTEAIKHNTEEFLKKLNGKFAAALKSSGNDMSTVWQDVEKEASGGEKQDLPILNNAKHMMDVIEKSKNTISELERTYKKQLDALSKSYKLVDKADTDMKSAPENIPTAVVSAARRKLSATYDSYKTKISHVQALTNTCQSKNIKYVQSMVSEYMSALSKFSSIKKKKD